MSSVRSSPAEEQRDGHPSLQTEQDVEETSPRMTEEETEQQAAARSPLNSRIPRIPTEDIKPVVVLLLARATEADLTDQESREALVQMILKLISAFSDLILDAFRNMVLEEREQEARLLVSEEAIRKAVCPSLCDSFTAALGYAHQSMIALFKAMSEEVTSHVNSVLCCCQMKGERLVVPEESDYRPSKKKMKAMVGHARTALRSFKDKMNQSWRGCNPTHGASPAEQQEETPTSTEEEESVKIRKNRLRETVRRCVSCGSRSERQKSTDEEERDEEHEHSTHSSLTEDEANISRKWRLGDKLDRFRPCGGRRQKYSDEEESEEEQPRSKPFRGRLCPWFTPGTRGSPDPATKEVERILLAEAVELSGEEEGNLRSDSQETAFSIVSLLSDKTLSPCLTGLSNKIKSFFTLCFAKAAFRRLLRQLSCSPESLEEVMEEASPLLQELVQEEGDVYQTLPNQISQGKFKELWDKLTDVITTRMAPGQRPENVSFGLRIVMQGFLSEICNWMHIQTQLRGLKNPVQRALERIRRLVFRISRSAPSTHQLTLMEPVPAPDVPRATPERLEPQPKFWSQKDCNVLVYEVVSRIFQRNLKMMIPLSKELMTLCEKVSEWNIQVEPSVRSCEDVASAVYKELCKGQKKAHVMHAALVQSDFSSEVLDAIHRHLTAPQEKRRTLGSFLRSVCCAICRR